MKSLERSEIHPYVRENYNEDTGVGEVWAKGSNIMQGYFNNPDATQQSLK